ncbi:MAG: hypothetical protein DHS20C18_31710 [Saprospiraceae bacterium]|nr:MAG: hypothetical protein DHS20C18_31710 [Saprospiraceae bacterium]
MVAQKNTMDLEQKPPSPRTPGWIFLLAVIIAISLAIPKWKDVVRKNEDGDYELQEWRKDERYIELDRNENAEQYRLIAKVSGYYLCYLCENKRTWINMGETLKIGITTNKTERYRIEWLDKQKAYYFKDVEGDLATVRRAEIQKIAAYPLWPENLNRSKSERLVVPPFHKTVRLK